MRAIKTLLFVVLAAAALPAGRSTAADKVDLLLVLAADVSRSIDNPKFQLQREGYAAAVSNPRVLDAVRSGHNGRIGVTYVEWSGVGSQRVLIDWTALGDAESAKVFGDRLLEAPRSFADRTSISGAIEFAMAQFARAPFESVRRTIDISGDGTNNAGRDVTLARDEAVAKGITINGLVILSATPLPVESRPHQSAGRAGQLLPHQCRRRSRCLRAGGQGLQLVRRGHHRKDDR